jgi:hypothetical protein
MYILLPLQHKEGLNLPFFPLLDGEKSLHLLVPTFEPDLAPEEALGDRGEWTGDEGGPQEGGVVWRRGRGGVEGEVEEDESVKFGRKMWKGLEGHWGGARTVLFGSIRGLAWCSAIWEGERRERKGEVREEEGGGHYAYEEK